MRKELSALRYSRSATSQATVRRQYQRWRAAQGLPIRCDNAGCPFHTEPLLWNGRPLKPILDHVDGNRRDNRPERLRYLCPNCDSQLHTRGGGNRGRVEERADGFTIKRLDGTHATDVFFTEAVQLADHQDAHVVSRSPKRCGRGPTRA
jgi:hypothetical protein